MADAGRPSSYTQEIGDEICARLAAGETLLTICATEGMPNRSTVWRWREADETFRNAYARAQQERLELMADEIVTISDDGSRDYMKTDDGRILPDHDLIQRSRLRVDTRKWLLSKLAPRTYGDKVDLNHAGSFSVSLSGADAKL